MRVVISKTRSRLEWLKTNSMIYAMAVKTGRTERAAFVIVEGKTAVTAPERDCVNVMLEERLSQG